MESKTSTGFTIVELVTVIVLLGILSAIALPRFFNQSTFTDFFNATEFSSAINWARNKALTTQCAHELRVTSSGWMVLRDDDKDGSNSDNDCSSVSDPGSGCSGSQFFSFVYRDDSDIVTDASQTSLSGSQITSSNVHRFIFTAQGELYDLPTLPTNLANGCTDLTSATPLASNSTISLNGVSLSVDGATAYVAIQ